MVLTTMKLEIFRWEPGASEKFQDFTIEPREGMTILDALVEIQRTQDPTLAFRYYCRVGMCGSCGMVVNGQERWACRTLLATLGSETITVRPLYNLPLLRDLVVDPIPQRQKMAELGAVFVPKADGESATQFAPINGDSAERRAIDPAIQCIGCGMCVSACEMVAQDSTFLGPLILNRLFTLQTDSRDDAHGERQALLMATDSLSRCHTHASCGSVCPMGINPAQSIIALRRQSLARPK